MSIHNRLLSYASLVAQGRIRSTQLSNFILARLMPKHECVRWSPTHLSIFVTNRCTFHCNMCPTHSFYVPADYQHRHESSRDMTPELLRFILDRYPSALRVELIGTGEPLLNPHLYALIRECVTRHMIVDTVSNGLIVHRHAKRLISSGLDRLCISINGHSELEFSRMTGMRAEYHSQILANVAEVVRIRGAERTPRIEVSFIVDQDNYHCMEQMITLAEKLGVDGVNFYNFLPTPYAGYTAAERCLYVDCETVTSELDRLASKHWACSVTWPLLLERFKCSHEIRQPCRWPFTLLQVDGEGNVGACPSMMLSMRNNGCITDNGVWNNQYFRRLRKRHLNNDPMDACKHCGECMGTRVV